MGLTRARNSPINNDMEDQSAGDSFRSSFTSMQQFSQNRVDYTSSSFEIKYSSSTPKSKHMEELVSNTKAAEFIFNGDYLGKFKLSKII